MLIQINSDSQRDKEMFSITQMHSIPSLICTVIFSFLLLKVKADLTDIFWASLGNASDWQASQTCARYKYYIACTPTQCYQIDNPYFEGKELTIIPSIVIPSPLGLPRIAVSEDCQHITVVFHDSIDQLYYHSSNYGDSFTEFGSSFNGVYYNPQISSNGSIQTLVGNMIASSQNYGKDWTEFPENRFEYGNVIGMTSDGKYQDVGGLPQNTYNTSDFGVTWGENGHALTSFDRTELIDTWCKSPDVRYQMVTQRTGVFFSYDFGHLWYQVLGGGSNDTVTTVEIGGAIESVSGDIMGGDTTSNGYGRFVITENSLLYSPLSSLHWTEIPLPDWPLGDFKSISVGNGTLIITVSNSSLLVGTFRDPTPDPFCVAPCINENYVIVTICIFIYVLY